MKTLRRFYPIPPDVDPLDRSTHGFRQLLGWLGMLLPLLCVLWTALFPTTITGLEGETQVTHLDSVSAYYYTSAVWAFVGILVAMGLFLLTYKGYEDRAGPLDFWLSTLTGVAAIGVAVFPTWPINALPRPSWWAPWMATAHIASALSLFLLFIVFCWVLFPGKDWRLPGDDSRSLSTFQRVVKYPVYHGCGLLILVCLVWAGIQLSHDGGIFWQEWFALWFFGIAWLRKGQVQWTLREGLMTRPIIRGAEGVGKYVRDSLFRQSA